MNITGAGTGGVPRIKTLETVQDSQILDWLPSMSESRGRSEKQSSKDKESSRKTSQIQQSEANLKSELSNLDRDEQNDYLFEQIVKM